MNLKLGSLFDGSGTAPLAATMCGIEPVWASEIEKYPIAVTTARFPNMKHLGDITKIDGLRQEWKGVCWMNPPYGREIGKWVRKAYESARDNNATVVCLLPARTDTKWFHDYCIPYGEITFVKGRLKFGGAKSGAPFPSAVVVFNGKKERHI